MAVPLELGPFSLLERISQLFVSPIGPGDASLASCLTPISEGGSRGSISLSLLYHVPLLNAIETYGIILVHQRGHLVPGILRAQRRFGPHTLAFDHLVPAFDLAVVWWIEK